MQLPGSHVSAAYDAHERRASPPREPPLAQAMPVYQRPNTRLKLAKAGTSTCR
jgi:hypothetical protein